MASPSSSASSDKKKITVFTPSDIRKIGLDKLIKVQLKKDAPSQSSAKLVVKVIPESVIKPKDLKPQEDENEETNEMDVTTKITADEEANEKQKVLFCSNLKKSMQIILNVPKTNEDKDEMCPTEDQEEVDYVIKGQKGATTDTGSLTGEKFKIMNNEVIGLTQETLDNILKQQRKKSPMGTFGAATEKEKIKPTLLNGVMAITLHDIDERDERNIFADNATTSDVEEDVIEIATPTTKQKIESKFMATIKSICDSPMPSVSGGKQRKTSTFLLPVDKSTPKFKTPIRVYKRKREGDDTVELAPTKKLEDVVEVVEIPDVELKKVSSTSSTKQIDIQLSKRSVLCKVVESDDAIEIEVSDDACDDIDREEEKEVEVVPTPKKRGRRSNVERARLAKLQDENSVEDVEDVVVQSLPPSKRGRIPKPKVFENYVTDNTKRTGTLVRGRRKSRHTINDDFSSDLDSADEDDKTLDDIRQEAVTKRGPKSKTAKSKANGEPSETSESATSTPQKRRPGRPRKTPIVTKTDSPIPAQAKVNKVGRKRKRSVEESPSTSAAEGVDEPSKKLKLQENINTTENANVADQNIDGAADDGEEEKEEDAYTKQYRLLVSNLVNDIRNEIARSEPKPKSSDQTVKTITCAICQEFLTPREWPAHKQRKHNNIAWKTTEKQLDLDNQSVIIATLNALYPSKPFYCNSCGDSKKSVLGFLTHKVTCSRSPQELEALKLPCKLCPKMLMPYQVIDHEKRHRQNERIKIETTILPDDLTQKRKAARKATELIQQVSKELITSELKKFIIKNDFAKQPVKDLLKQSIETSGSVNCLFASCDVKFDTIDNAMEHMGVCTHKPEIFFICKFCAFVHEILADMCNHITDNHREMINEKEGNDENFDYTNCNVEIDDDDEDTSNSSRYSKRKSVAKSFAITATHSNAFWKLQKFGMLVKSENLPDLKDPYGVNAINYGKMIDFCKAHYSNANLFPNYPFKKASWFPLNKNYIKEFLPLFKLSIPIGTMSKSKPTGDETFSRYKLFQTTVINGVATMYCGGPISAMAWAPTPHHKEDAEQILAVCVQQNPGHKYHTNKTHTNKSIIQLWNFGLLHNKRPMDPGTAPKLELCIAHNYGGIFSMEWCPSGCYESDGTRLGILAIASTDSHVYFYTIGHSNLLTEKIFKPKPIFKLVLSETCDNNFGANGFYATKLSWSKFRGHEYVAVGYTNGCVAMFNLQTDNELLKGVDPQNIPIVYPFKTFKAHNLSISAIALHHIDGGSRWLVTSSIDRHFKFWDLDSSNMKPLALTKRGTSYQVLWPINSIITINPHDDTSSNLFLTSIASQLVSYDYGSYTTMLFSNAAVRAISGNDWGATAYHANEIGEVVGGTYNNLYPFMLEVSCKRFMCSSTSLVCVSNEEKSMEEDNNFESVQKNYKVLFRDYTLDNPKNVVKQERAKQGSNMGDSAKYQLRAATAISTNNNRYSFLFTAVGYNIGFVRVFHSKFQNV